MNNSIRIHPNIIQALSSESSSATPFSHIPAFLKRVALNRENEEKILSLLQIVCDKEVNYLNDKVNQIKSSSLFDAKLYSFIRQIESSDDAHKQKLIGLAKEIIASEMGSGAYTILNKVKVETAIEPIDPGEFKNDHIDLSESLGEKEKATVQEEQQVRVVINALIMGAGHRIFDHIGINDNKTGSSSSKYERSINKMDPALYQAYYDMVYANLKYMWENDPTVSAGSQMNLGLMKLISENDEAKIQIQADIFPVLLHEMAKGVLEYIAYTRYNDMSPEVVKSILSVDSRESEHRMMLVGPQIYKQLFFLVKEAIAQFSENNFLIDGKKEPDYIIPVIYKIIQLPAGELLAFVEQILNPLADGSKSISLISSLIEQIHAQYEQHIGPKQTQKIQLTVEQIAEQIAREFSFSEHEKHFVEDAFSRVKDILANAGYTISDKLLARKIGEFVPLYVRKYNPNQLHDRMDSRLTELSDTVSQWAATKREISAFAKLRESQKKVSFKTKDAATKETKYVQPRFTLAELDQAKRSISQKTLDEIHDHIQGTLSSTQIEEWLRIHDEMSTQKSELTEQLITLDNTPPACIADFGSNRGLYELTKEEQLKRESGMMGGHCVDDHYDKVEGGTMKVFSLRHGTQSHRTIGYTPEDHTIIQVKGYTNKVKNSILSKDEPDFPYVMIALQALCEEYKVQTLNDIRSEYKAGYLITGSDGNLVSVSHYKKADNKKEQYYNISAKYENKSNRDITWDPITMSLVVTLSMKDDFAMKIYEKGVIKKYYPKRVILGYEKSYMFFQKDKKGHYTQFASLQYDKFPTFGAAGLLPNQAVIVKDKKYGILQRNEDDSFSEVLLCKYDDIPAKGQGEFGGNIFSPHFEVIVVSSDGKFGIVEKDEYNMFHERVACVYDKKPKRHDFVNSNNVAEVMKNGKCGLLARQKNGKWKEVIECEYDKIKTVAHNRNKISDKIFNRDIIVRKGKKDGILRAKGSDYSGKYESGSYKQVFDFVYDEIQEFGNQYIMLPNNETFVLNNGKKGVLRRYPDGTYEEVLPCKYDEMGQDGRTSMFGVDGLCENDTRIRIEDKIGVVRRYEDGAYKIVLDVDYMQSNEINKKHHLWKFGVDDIYQDDAFVAKPQDGIKDPLIGIVRRSKYGEYEEVLPCKYHFIGSFAGEGTPVGEAWVRIGANRGIVRKNPDNTYEEILPCVCSKPVNFEGDEIEIISERGDKTILIRNNEESGKPILYIDDISENHEDGVVIQHGDQKDLLWKRIAGGKYEQVALPEGVTRVKNRGKFGLHDNEYRVAHEGMSGIMKEENGVFSLVCECIYEAFEEFGKYGLDENEARVVRDGGWMGVIRRVDGKFVEVVEPGYHHIDAFDSEELPKGFAKTVDLNRKDDGKTKLYGVIYKDREGSFQELSKPTYEIPLTVSGSQQESWLLPDEYVVSKNNKYCIVKYRDEKKDFDVVLGADYVFSGYDTIDNDAANLPSNERLVWDNNRMFSIIRRIEGGKRQKITQEPLEAVYSKKDERFAKMLDDGELFVEYDRDESNIIRQDAAGNYKKMFPQNITLSLSKIWYEYEKDDIPTVCYMGEERIDGKRFAFTNDRKNPLPYPNLSERPWRKVALRKENDLHEFEEIKDEKQVEALIRAHEFLREAYLQIQFESTGGLNYPHFYCVKTQDGRELWAEGFTDREIGRVYEFSAPDQPIAVTQTQDPEEIHKLLQKYPEFERERFLPF